MDEWGKEKEKNKIKTANFTYPDSLMLPMWTHWIFATPSSERHY